MSVIPMVRPTDTGSTTSPIVCGWCGETQFVVRSLGTTCQPAVFVRCRSCTVNDRLLADLVDRRSGPLPPRRPDQQIIDRAAPDRRTCVSSKVFYRSASAATAGLLAWRKRRKPGQSRGQIYDCRWCPGWHLTSGKTRRRPVR